MGRSIIGVIVGILAGVLVISLMQWLGHMVYPTPEGADMKDPSVVAEYIKTAPAGAISSVLLGYLFGSMTAGFVSTKVAKVNHTKLGLICGIFMLLAVIMVLLSIPHPMWFMIACLLLIVPKALLGAKFATKK